MGFKAMGLYQIRRTRKSEPSNTVATVVLSMTSLTHIIKDARSVSFRISLEMMYCL